MIEALSDTWDELGMSLGSSAFSLKPPIGKTMNPVVFNDIWVEMDFSSGKILIWL